MTTLSPGVLTPAALPTPRTRRVACARCGSAAVPDEPFCAHCGTRVAITASGRRPADVAATRSLQFAALVVAANAVVGTLTFAAVYLVSDAARLADGALALEGIKLLVVGVLATASIRYGVRGIRETADGALRRRGWAVAGIVISSFFAVLVLASFSLVLLLAVAL
ncbi:hypothetical protein [Homoserinibacter sp. GY 40078]|uniref:hypothetical protein n=1 Tax=Homoserinibacter sp. GY 40078 TaxID=2603275 RepID=UPI0011CC4E0F|nr:hypothetical protein [Homoserinibacter sp. GY 40078]TXK19805.1 hypothetical protein FVQ89_08080 [Homoserinibacter sp. GY 40078]